jgi:hypothetical protein
MLASILLAAAAGCAQLPTPQAALVPSKHSPAAIAAPTQVVMAQPVVYMAAVPTSRTVVWGPTPVGYTLAWLGRLIQPLGQPHVMTIRRPTFVPMTIAPAAVPTAALPAAEAASPPPLVPLASQQAVMPRQDPTLLVPRTSGLFSTVQ